MEEDAYARRVGWSGRRRAWTPKEAMASVARMAGMDRILLDATLFSPGRAVVELTELDIKTTLFLYQEVGCYSFILSGMPSIVQKTSASLEAHRTWRFNPGLPAETYRPINGKTTASCTVMIHR